MVSIIFAILATLGITGVFLTFLQENASLLFMLLPLGFWFFVVAPVVVWKKEREKVLEYERVDLELIVGNGEQYIHQRGTNWIFRIGIKTNSRKSVNNVGVVVAKRGGKEHAYSDAPLRPPYTLLDNLTTFSVKPDETKFIEVCSWNLGSPFIRIHYNANYQMLLKYTDEKYENQYHLPPQMLPFLLDNIIPLGETIEVCGTGDNVTSVSKTLCIDTSGNQPKWKEISEDGQKG